MKNKDVFSITWRGIEIEIGFILNYSEAYRQSYGYSLSHIEVKSLSPAFAQLPITETGYRSIFITEPELTVHGGVQTFVLAMLEESANSKEWIAFEEESKQYQLF